MALTFDGVSLKSYLNGELVLTSLPIVGDLTPWSTEMIWGTELALLNRVRASLMGHIFFLWLLYCGILVPSVVLEPLLSLWRVRWASAMV